VYCTVAVGVMSKLELAVVQYCPNVESVTPNTHIKSKSNFFIIFYIFLFRILNKKAIRVERITYKNKNIISINLISTF
jgi:hypothetical protein